MTATIELDWDQQLNNLKNRVHTALAVRLNLLEAPDRLKLAMQHAVLNGGKRLRPLLVYAAGLALGATPDGLDLPAMAVEYMHCYSLVHDDLPAMDNADLRRGQPTCHRAFDEATALLVGDALQSLAFECLATPMQTITSSQQLSMIRYLTVASGASGMAGGQQMDLAANTTSLSELIKLHRLKTGALIAASLCLGALATPHIDEATINTLESAGYEVGLAFQIQDDLLDAHSTPEILGKPTGQDYTLQKVTFLTFLDSVKAQEYCDQTFEKGLSLIKSLPGDLSLLQHLCHRLIHRDR